MNLKDKKTRHSRITTPALITKQYLCLVSTFPYIIQHNANHNLIKSLQWTPTTCSAHLFGPIDHIVEQHDLYVEFNNFDTNFELTVLYLM
jgi:hypothetical protein